MGTQDAKENPTFDKDGKEVKGNFAPGVKQEITYVYQKTEITSSDDLDDREDPNNPLGIGKPHKQKKPDTGDKDQKSNKSNIGENKGSKTFKSDKGVNPKTGVSGSYNFLGLGTILAAILFFWKEERIRKIK